MENINLIPTYEQYLEDYIVDEQISNSYELESQAWNEIKSIGCGNKEYRETAKALTKVVIKNSIVFAGTAALTTATGGLGTIVIGGLIYTEGWLIGKMAEKSDNELIGHVADVVKDIGMFSAAGGAISSLGSISKASSINQVLKANVGELVKDLETAKDAIGAGSDLYKTLEAKLHGKHLDEGKLYDENCSICNKRRNE